MTDPILDLEAIDISHPSEPTCKDALLGAIMPLLFSCLMGYICVPPPDVIARYQPSFIAQQKSLKE
jgi:hypothetical protein